MTDTAPPAKQSIDYAQLLNALNQASTFDLFRLHAIINNELDSPERIRRIKMSLSVGQKLSYLEPASNALHECEILQLKPKRAHVFDLTDGKRWNVPYYMLNIEGADVRVHHEVSKGLSRHAISVGDVLGFKDKHGVEHTGKVLRLNPKSVTLDVTDTGRNIQWRVSYALLYRILDGQAGPSEELLIEGECITDG
ncbi:hypothetical protein [Sansalvadorimonas verongulae]|uniref:hypothetical protein n=1 Tax=Sansalvadorimonas verongulae TaxID=2172824 RepID=UPI0012BD38EB|nr:hypothetical protein [Sansalvadorimonas verongulae]MTI12954.1 hypothetical protein [Sansalvadorimonas verongulae]